MTYSVMVTRTRTIVQTVEIEVTAKDEESAEEKITQRVEKAQAKSAKNLQNDFDWEDSEDNDEFEYEVSEA